MTHPLRQSVNVPGAEPLYGNYSSSVVVSPGRLLFVSGQVATDENGKTIGAGDVKAQCECVLEKIEKIVAYNGGKMSDVVQDRVYVTDHRSRSEVLPIRLKHFPNNGPTSCFIEVASLASPEWLIEIEVVAALP